MKHLKKPWTGNGPTTKSVQNRKTTQSPSLVFTFILLLTFGLTFAQQKEITGTISDGSGQPLPGANVLVKGTSTGTQSDFDGNYIIMASTGDVLIFSYLGFTSQSITVGDQSTINAVLQEDAALLDEVVVTGYGSQTRATLTTSVSKLDTQILESSTRSNAATALQGTIAGLRVTNTTGNPELPRK